MNKNKGRSKGQNEYIFVVAGTVTFHVTVRADSLEKAVEKAQSASVMSLCHQCSKGEDGEWSTSGELDFVPAETSLEEVYGGAGETPEELLRAAQSLWGGE